MSRARLRAFFFARLSSTLPLPLPLLSRHVRNNFSGRDSRRRRRTISSTNRGNLYYVNVIAKNGRLWLQLQKLFSHVHWGEVRHRDVEGLIFFFFGDVELCSLAGSSLIAPCRRKNLETVCCVRSWSLRGRTVTISTLRPIMRWAEPLASTS